MTLRLTLLLIIIWISSETEEREHLSWSGSHVCDGLHSTRKCHERWM